MAEGPNTAEQQDGLRAGFASRCSATAYGHLIYLFGGLVAQPDGVRFVSHLLAFDTTTNGLTGLLTTGPTPKPRIYHSAMWKDDSLVIFGGLAEDGSILADMHVVTIDGTQQWAKVLPVKGGGSLPALCCHSCVKHPERNSMLILCGKGKQDLSPATYEFDFGTRTLTRLSTFSQTGNTEGPKLLNALASAVGNTVVVVGGSTAGELPNTAVYSLDLDTMMWRTIVIGKTITDKVLREGLFYAFDADQNSLWLCGRTSWSCSLQSKSGKLVWNRRHVDFSSDWSRTGHRDFGGSADEPQPPRHCHLALTTVNGTLFVFAGESRLQTTDAGNDSVDGYFCEVYGFSFSSGLWFRREVQSWVSLATAPTRHKAPEDSLAVPRPASTPLPILTHAAHPASPMGPSKKPLSRQPVAPLANTKGVQSLLKQQPSASSVLSVMLRPDPATLFRENVRIALRSPEMQLLAAEPQFIVPTEDKKLRTSFCRFNLNSTEYPPGSDLEARVNVETKDVTSTLQLDFTELNRHIHMSVLLTVTLNEERNRLAEERRAVEREKERQQEAQREIERQQERQRDLQREAEKQAELRAQELREQERQQEAQRDVQRQAERAQELLRRKQDEEREAARRRDKEEELRKELHREMEREEEERREKEREAERQEEAEFRAEVERQQAAWKQREAEWLAQRQTADQAAHTAKLALLMRQQELEREVAALTKQLRSMQESFEEERRCWHDNLHAVIEKMEKPLRLELGREVTYFFQCSALPVRLFPRAFVAVKGPALQLKIHLQITRGFQHGDELSLGTSGSVTVTGSTIFIDGDSVGELLRNERSFDDNEAGVEVSPALCISFFLRPEVNPDHLETLLHVIRFFTSTQDSSACSEREITVRISGKLRAEQDAISEILDVATSVVNVLPPILWIPASETLKQYRPQGEPDGLRLLEAVTTTFPEGVVQDDTFVNGDLTFTIRKGYHPGDNFHFRDDAVTVTDGEVAVNGVLLGKIVTGAINGFGKPSATTTILLTTRECTAQTVEVLLKAIWFSNNHPGLPQEKRVIEIALHHPRLGESVLQIEVTLVLGDAPTVMTLKRHEVIFRSTTGDLLLKNAEFVQPQLLWFAGDATVTDVDTDDFRGGECMVALINSRPGDAIEITPMSGCTDFRTDGDEVLYKEAVIGYIEPRDEVNQLRVTFTTDGAATVRSVQELVRALTFSNNSTTPQPGTRTIDIELCVGAQQEALREKIALRVTGPLVSVPPNAPCVEYKEGAPMAKLGPFDVANLTQEKSTGYLGGILRAEIVSGFEPGDEIDLVRTSNDLAFKQEEDRIATQKPIESTSRSRLAAEKTTEGFNIYRISGGKVGTDLLGRLHLLQNGLAVEFSRRRAGAGAVAELSHEDVQLILRHLVYRNLSKAMQYPSKLVSVQLDDGRCGRSQCFVELEVKLVNDATEIIVSKTDLVYRQGSRWSQRGFQLLPDVLLEDPDTFDFNGGFVAFELVAGGDSGDHLYIMSEAQQVERLERLKKNEDTRGIMAVASIKRVASEARQIVEARAREMGTTPEGLARLRQQEREEKAKLEPKFEEDLEAQAPPIGSMGSLASPTSDDQASGQRGSRSYSVTRRSEIEEFVSVRSGKIYMSERLLGTLTIVGSKIPGNPGSELRVDFNSVDGQPIDLEAVAQVLRVVAYNNTTPKVKEGKRVYQLRLTAGDGAPETRLKIGINVLGPLLWIPGYSVSLDYRENSGDQYVASKIVINLPEKETLTAGYLVAQFANDTWAEGDSLGFHFSKRGEKFTFVSNSFKLYVGREAPANYLGKIVVSSKKVAFDFDRNSKITKAHIQQLARSITFRHASENPSTHPRLVELMLSDGTTFDQSLCTVEIQVLGVDDPTEIRIQKPEIAFVAGSAAVFVAPDVTVIDVDTPIFDPPAYVQLTLAPPSRNDFLELSPANGVGVSPEGAVSVFGTPVGLLDTSAAPSLCLTLDHCPLESLQAILRSITFKNTSEKEAGAKKMVSITVQNARNSPPSRVAVTISMLPPLLDLSLCPAVKYNSKKAELDLVPAARAKAADPDKGFAKGSLTVSIRAAAPEDQISLKLRGSLVAKKDALYNDKDKIGTLTISPDKIRLDFGTDGKGSSAENVQRVIRALVYTNTAKALSEAKTFDLLLVDGLGNSTSSATVVS